MINAKEAMDLTIRYPFESELKMIEDQIINQCKLGKTELTMSLLSLDKKYLDLVIVELQVSGYRVDVSLNNCYGAVITIGWGK